MVLNLKLAYIGMVAARSLTPPLQWKPYSASQFLRRNRPSGVSQTGRSRRRALSFPGALSGVPDDVVVTPCSDTSAFLGVNVAEGNSRHVFNLGIIQEARLLCLYRFKIWWMIPRVGRSARDIPVETQMLLVETEEDKSYVLFLPVLDGECRSSLQGSSAGDLQVCVETGDSGITVSVIRRAVFIGYGQNPYDLIKQSFKTLQEHTGTFALRETKQMPGILDCFGWCTWDAFYHDVDPRGIRDGLKSLSEGGTPARFLIIDDGWQDTTNEFQKDGEPSVLGSQFGARLKSVRENSKFRKTANDGSDDDKPGSLKDFISEIKTAFDLKYVYVWHALMGYWGGLDPAAPGTKKYNPTLKYPRQSPGNLAHFRDTAMDAMERYGVGVVDLDRISEFYDDLHSYLVSQEVDGVKVDVQNLLETVATGSGGRVSLARRFQQSLEKSIAKNFQDNSIICCMAQNTDSVYNLKKNAITRASDDYYPKSATTQTRHVASVAYNSLFFGEVVVPDWDMFYSLHEAAEFHAVARAVGGCPVYVSDKPGEHDFEVLKKLVLQDGSVLRAKYPGLPCRDCLFDDPVTDGKSLLKIWNLNKMTAVVAVFNCQGCGTWPGMEESERIPDAVELSGEISPSDVEYLQEISPGLSNGDYAVFSFQSGSVVRLPALGKLSVAYKTLECDIFTLSPIQVVLASNQDHQGVEFAPIGLINMYNSGGAVHSVEATTSGIRIQGRGEGIFGGYSNLDPKSCTVNGKESGFRFDGKQHFLTVEVPGGSSSWEVVVHY